MVDKALFIDTGGAKQAMHRLEMITNNLANANTIGFKADHDLIKHVPANGDDKQARVYSQITGSYSNFDLGPMITTGRDLDVAVNGSGFIAIQTKAGDEAYTRAGNFQLKNGFLATQSGDLVLGTGGVISVPEEAERVHINAEGAVIIKIPNQSTLVTVDHIKLTNPANENLQKGKDGLFRLNGGESARIDDTIRLTSGALEGSNVNPVEALTELIEISRNFEFHTSLMKNFKDNASIANQILALH